MTKRQQSFCYLIAEGVSPTEAAEIAGYKKAGIAQKLLEMQSVQEAIGRIKCGEDGEGVACEEEILEFLTHAMRGQDSADMRIRIRAAELLSKRKMVVEKDDGSPILIIDDIP